MVKVRIDMTGWNMWEHDVPDSRITVLRQTEDVIEKNGKRVAQWLCECNCENHTIFATRGSTLRTGETKSCGCLAQELSSIRLKKYNDYQLNLEDENGLYGIGYCTNTGREFYFDMDDYDKIKDYSWCENKMKSGYCRLETHDKQIGQSILMHWIIVGKKYDHADRNPLNNRKYNLRVATDVENARNHNKQKNNTSGYIGVSFHSGKNKWSAYIVVDKKRNHLGSFINKDDAIRVRLKAEKQYFGEFAPQRHLFEEYNI